MLELARPADKWLRVWEEDLTDWNMEIWSDICKVYQHGQWQQVGIADSMCAVCVMLSSCSITQFLQCLGLCESHMDCKRPCHAMVTA